MTPSSLKRYLLFSFEAYEGTGGWEHFDESFETVEIAKSRVEAMKSLCGATNAHIVDLEAGKIVWEAYYDKRWKWREKN